MRAEPVVEIDPGTATLCSCHSEADSPSDPARIRVTDEIPVFRGALTRELEQRGVEVLPTDPVPIAEAVDLTVCGITTEQDWDALEGMLQDAPVFAIVPEPFEDNKVRALWLGAAGVSARNTPLPDLVSAICAIPRGHVIIDLQLLRRLCLSLAPEPPFELSGPERAWLRQLSGGTTIVALARENGYSEREMHRVMRRLYDRMGVSNLYQALIEATRFRLLD